MQGVEEPLQLLFLTVGQPDATMTNPRNLIRLGAGARLRLIETHGTLGQGHGLTNMVTQVELGEAAELVHDDGTLIATSTGVFKRVPGLNVPPTGDA